MAGPTERLNVVLAGRIRPVRATLVGSLVAVVVGAFFGIVHEGSARAVEALMLVVPVVGAAVVGGKRAAYAVAVVATLVFTFIIPPFGSPRIEVSQDIAALVVFLAVALVVGALVAARVESLDHIEQQREMLLRSVSHDFRTPLAIISAATSDLMQSPDYDDATRLHLQGMVLDEAGRLDRLVANLLNLSRIRSDGLHPKRQAVDLDELVEYSTSRLRRVFANVELQVDVPPGLPLIQADYTQMDQVLTNLLENAVRHSPPDGVVRLGVLQMHETVRITVSDDGPGIDPAEAEVIFEPFRSGSVPGTTGVGLAICRAIVEAHGGTIEAVTPPDGGAQFVVTLPY